MVLGVICLLGCMASPAEPGNAAEYLPSDRASESGQPDVAPSYLGPHPEASSPIISEDTARELNGLASCANDWQEPSARSEERYVLAIRQWLESLDPKKREVVHGILGDAHPTMQALRVAIREKKSQLASLSFNRSTTPDTLPRLGQELASLRRTLNIKLQEVAARLHDEAGVSMGPLGGDGFWLAPSDDPALQSRTSRHSSLARPANPGLSGNNSIFTARLVKSDG